MRVLPSHKPLAPRRVPAVASIGTACETTRAAAHEASVHERGPLLQPTDIRNPDYFHKVVDCQWACPSHTPVPEYIRLIAAGRYSDAYLVNWKSNVFPGILGRTCDRPCEPACRRGRVEEENQPKPEPVAICRLKRVAADYKDVDEIKKSMPRPAKKKNGKRVIVLGGGNTAMDCCRTSKRIGGEDVKVIVRSGYDEMKASPWEKEDAQHEGIPILNYLVPKSFILSGGKLSGMTFEKVKAVYDDKGQRNLVPTGEPDQFFPCDDVLVAIGQENAFPWIERDSGVQFDKWGLPVVDKTTMQSTVPNVFFGGDAAFGPKNIIWAVAHGHDAAISIEKLMSSQDLR